MATPSFRRHIVAEWRGYREPKEGRPVSAVSDLVGSLVTRLGLGERICEQEILSAWRDIVGDFLAGHSTPARLVGGVLHVQVLQPTVRYELETRWRSTILEKLRSRFGTSTVKDLKFRI